MGLRRAPLLLAAVMTFVCAVGVSAEGAAPAADKNIYGYWKSLDKDTGKTQSIFRLWEDKGKLVGKVVKTFPRPNGEKPQERCTECEGKQKDKPVVGLIFLWGLELDKENPRKWNDGKVLNPEDGKTYNAELTLADDAKTLTIYGYIKMLVKLGGSNVWQRPTSAELEGVSSGS